MSATGDPTCPTCGRMNCVSLSNGGLCGAPNPAGSLWWELETLKAELAEARKERDGLHAQLAAVKEDVEAGEHLIGVMQESAKRLNLKYEGDQEFILLVERQLSAVTRERDGARCDLAAMKCRVALLSGDAANALEAVMKELDSANADADLLGRAVHEYGKPFNERTATAMQAVYNRPTAAARVKGADVGLQSAIDRHVAKSAEIVSRIPPRNRTILSKREAQERGPWWLIERSQPEGQDPPCWWNEVTEKWEKDASAATRWETKAEAETVLSKREGIRGVHSQWGHVSEHIFI